MATIFYPVGGSLSALTPKKVTAFYWTVPGGATYDRVTTERYVPFTPSIAGDMIGAMVPFLISSYVAGNTATVKLQRNTGSWVDVAGATCTKTYAQMQPSHPNNGAMVSVYFSFTVPAAITAAAATWRLAVSGTGNCYLWKNGSDYLYAAVLNDNTAYAPGDNIFLVDNASFTIDQNVTANVLTFGCATTLTWGAAPAASYELDVETLNHAKNMTVLAGTALSPIPAAQQAIFDVAAHGLCAGWVGDAQEVFRLYGQKPTYYFTKLAADALGSQKNLVTTEDMSAYWNAGDTVVVLGRDGTVGYTVGTISSVVGTTVTLGSNLTAVHFAGWCVWNQTRFAANCGIQIQGSQGLYSLGCANVVLSGAYLGASRVAVSASSVSAAAEHTFVDVLDTVMSGSTASLISYTMSASYGYKAGSQFKNIFQYGTYSTNVSLNYVKQGVFSDIYRGDSGSTWPLSLAYLYGGTVTDVQGCGGGVAIQLASAWSVTVTRLRAMGCGSSSSDGSLTFSGANVSFVDCAMDGGLGTHAVFLGTIALATFSNCEFDQDDAGGTAAFGVASTGYCQVLCSNCSDFTVNEAELAAASAGSYIKAGAFDDAANDHRSWWLYGCMVSTGTGLTDTTVHTAGAGKFALRFEPKSSLYNLDWSINVPTGNIATKTMTVGIWVKINAAAFYAGVHQKPRLTVNYDNGTLAYAEATASTDWQLLAVNFTPVTSFGQITVTLSGRTDAVGANAYVYWDDFAVLYPAGYALDLGGLDLWADALPIVPPIATVLSAKDVWTASRLESYGLDTMGEVLKAITSGDPATIAAAVWAAFSLPLPANVRSGITYGVAGALLTGTLALPAAAAVKAGVQYGAGGTEYTGTLPVGGMGNKKGGKL